MFRRANGIPIDRKVSPDFNNLPTESVSFVRGRRKSTETSEEKNMKLAPPTLIVVVVKKKSCFLPFSLSHAGILHKRREEEEEHKNKRRRSITHGHGLLTQ